MAPVWASREQTERALSRTNVPYPYRQCNSHFGSCLGMRADYRHHCSEKPNRSDRHNPSCPLGGCVGMTQRGSTERGLTIGARTYGSIASILRTGLDRAFHDDKLPPC